MTSSIAVVQELKAHWGSPRRATHRGDASPFLLQCAFSPPATEGKISSVPNVPKALTEFWEQAEHADLFKDTQYGQWGIRILSPDEALQATLEYQSERASDAMASDLVIGTFYGDSDLVILRCDTTCSDYGNVVIALPIDPRLDWETVADDFAIFLAKLTEEQGAKFWE